MPTIIEMVNHTRLDCVIGSAAGMRAGVAQAHPPRRPPLRLRQAADRPAADAQRAGRPLRSSPRRRPIAAMRLARAYDEAPPATRRRPCSSGSPPPCSSTGSASGRPSHAAEALECLGGNGYVEESGMPRLFRESPLNSIWEGSGNVQCLDVLRAMVKSPGLGRGLLRRGRRGAPAPSPPRRLRRRRCATRSRTTSRRSRPRARRMVERMALALQGSLLVRHGDAGRRRRLLRLPPRRRLGPGLRHPARPASTSPASSPGTAA